MAQLNDRLDKVVRDAQRNADLRAKGRREQALKFFAWVRGRYAERELS